MWVCTPAPPRQSPVPGRSPLAFSWDAGGWSCVLKHFFLLPLQQRYYSTLHHWVSRHQFWMILGLMKYLWTLSARCFLLASRTKYCKEVSLSLTLLRTHSTPEGCSISVLPFFQLIWKTRLDQFVLVGSLQRQICWFWSSNHLLGIYNWLMICFRNLS